VDVAFTTKLIHITVIEAVSDTIGGKLRIALMHDAEAIAYPHALQNDAVIHTGRSVQSAIGIIGLTCLTIGVLKHIKTRLVSAIPIDYRLAFLQWVVPLIILRITAVAILLRAVYE
jgi:hypothetical protein